MGHKPNNQKVKHSRGLWSPDEDKKLADYIRSNGHACWSSIPAKAGLQRNGKSCRLRWTNYLRPGLKRGAFTFEEREIVLTLHRMLGNKWAEISKYLPGRTDNEIKNYWHSNLKTKSNAKVEVSQTVIVSNVTNPSISSTSLESVNTLNTSSSLLGSSSMSTTECLPDTPATETNFTSQVLMPKLLFAEWLSTDHEQQNIPIFQGSNGDQLVPMDCFNQFMGSQECFLPEVSFEESSLYNDFNPPNGLYFSPPYELTYPNAVQESGPANEIYNPEGSFYSENNLY